MNVTAPPSSPLDRLHEDFGWTPRQRQVLALLAQRRTNGEIAEALGISLDGAKWHVNELMTKLGTHSRDDAAEYWRAYNRMPLRFSRSMRALTAAFSLRWALMAVGGLVTAGVIAVGISLVASFANDDDSRAADGTMPSPAVATTAPAGTTTASVTPTVGRSPEARNTQTGTPVPLVRQAVPNGGTLPSRNGLLYVDLSTGIMEFWPMPGEYYGVPSMSRDGRWVVWAAGQVGVPGSIDGGVHLLDTRSGASTLLTLNDEPAIGARLSNDGRFLMKRTLSIVALAETASQQVLASSSLRDGNPNGWAEFAGDGSVAIGFGPERGPRSTIILRPDGATAAIMGASWPLRWSPDSTQLAATAERATQIFSADGELLWEIRSLDGEPSGNPRWSPDGRHFSIANSGIDAGYRVFDALTRVEILRTVGSPACLEYWNADGTLRFDWNGRRLSVPGGDVLPAIGSLTERPFEYEQTNEVGLSRLKTAAGLTIDFKTSGSWSVYYDQDGVYNTTSDGRAFFLIGVGGKGLCGGGTPSEPAVLFPPF